MEIEQLQTLDTDIVYGIVNEKLRLECNSLDEVLAEFDLDKTHFEEKLAAGGYYYDAEVNQLRSF